MKSKLMSKMMKTLVALLVFTSAATAQANSKVLLVLTSHNLIPGTGAATGFWLSELTHPYFEFTKNGFTVDLASIKGGEAKIEPRSLNLEDEDNKAFMNQNAALLKKTKRLADMDPKKYKAIYFVGGHGAMWDFVSSKDVSRVASRIYENGGVVASVCHGPAALANIKLSNGQDLVSGKKVAGFTNEEEKAVKLDQHVPFLLEDKLKELGGIYSKAANFQSHVVADQRLVTGQNPASARGVATEVIKLLNSKESK